MYSEKVIAERLVLLQKAFPKWTPTYHSIEEVEIANKQFAEIYDVEARKFTRKLTPAQEAWIFNERKLCTVDFNYWATRYAFIRDWSGNFVRYVPNLAQRIISDIYAELEEADRALSAQDLKARQLGVSTDSELRIAHRVQFHSNTIAIIGSSDPDKSSKMAQMIERVYELQPAWLVPETTKHVRGEYMEFGGMHCSISIQHGAQKSGIGRGDTPNCCHLSEVSDFDDPAELVGASLLKSLHESAWSFLVLESTAQRRNDWWHKNWEFAKANYSKGRAKLKPIFLPWYIGRDIYPTDTWIRTRPVPEGWTPSTLVQKHADRACRYVFNTPLLRKYLGDNWKMPIEQMWFWEVERAEYANRDELHKFYAEMPADDLEAFQSANKSIFSAELVSNLREHTGKEPLAVYGFSGEKVPEFLHPERRDYDESGRVPPMTIEGINFIPLKWEAGPNFSPAGKLIIWSWPEDEYEYGIGVDTAEGLDMDSSCLEVVRKGTLQSPDVQCAEFNSSLANEFDIPPILFAIGLLFSGRVAGEYAQPKLIIEKNKCGKACQLEMIKLGWTNFHIPVKVDKRRLNIRDVDVVGFTTNSQTRPQMLANLVKTIRDLDVELNSPYLIDELGDLERDLAKATLKAASGCHDDRVFAMGICLYGLHYLETKAQLESIHEQRRQYHASNSHYPVYTGGGHMLATASPRNMDESGGQVIWTDRGIDD